MKKRKTRSGLGEAKHRLQCSSGRPQREGEVGAKA